MSSINREIGLGADLRRNIAVRCLAGALVISAALVLLWPTLAVLHTRWTTGFSYTHGYLVVVMSGWLVYRRIASEAPLAVSPWWPGLFAVGGVTLVIAVAQITGIDIAQQLLLPALIAAVTASVFGISFALRCALGVSFIYFAIPMWDILVEPLQSITTWVVSVALQWHSFPVFIDGYQVSVPAGEFQIAGGCSGLHYIIVSLTLGVFFAATDLTSWRDRTKVIFVALLLAFVTNWVRVYTLIIIGQYSDMQHYLITTDHYLYGWVLYAIAMAVFFVYVRRFDLVSTALPNRFLKVDAQKGVYRSLVLVAAIMLLGGLVRTAGIAESAELLQQEARLSVSASMQIRRQPIGDWAPVMKGSTSSASGLAMVSGNEYDWYLAHFAVQRNNSELVAWGNRPFGEDWQRVVGLEMRDQYRGARILSEYGRQRLVVWRQRVAGTPVYGTLNAKLKQIAGLLAGKRDADFLAISVACETDCTDELIRFSDAAELFMESAEIEFSSVAMGDRT